VIGKTGGRKRRGKEKGGEMEIRWGIFVPGTDAPRCIEPLQIGVVLVS